MSNSLADLIARDTQLEKTAETLGEFKAYIPEMEIPEIKGTRVVKCIYRGENAKKLSNQYCRVPTKHLTLDVVKANFEKLAPFVLDMLQAEEDKLIKNDHKNGALRIYTEYLSLDKILSSLEENSTNGRLNGEQITEWFESKLQDILMLTLAEKLNLDPDNNIDSSKLVMLCNTFKNRFVSLASPKTILQDSEREQLLKALSLLDDQDIIASKLSNRIETMKTKVADAVMGL